MSTLHHDGKLNTSSKPQKNVTSIPDIVISILLGSKESRILLPTLKHLRSKQFDYCITYDGRTTQFKDATMLTIASNTSPTPLITLSKSLPYLEIKIKDTPEAKQCAERLCEILKADDRFFELELEEGSEELETFAKQEGFDTYDNSKEAVQITFTIANTLTTALSQRQLLHELRLVPSLKQGNAPLYKLFAQFSDSDDWIEFEEKSNEPFPKFLKYDKFLIALATNESVCPDDLIFSKAYVLKVEFPDTIETIKEPVEITIPDSKYYKQHALELGERLKKEKQLQLFPLIANTLLVLEKETLKQTWHISTPLLESAKKLLSDEKPCITSGTSNKGSSHKSAPHKGSFFSDSKKNRETTYLVKTPDKQPKNRSCCGFGFGL